MKKLCCKMIFAQTYLSLGPFEHMYIYIYFFLHYYSFSLRQGFNFSKSNFWSKQWKGPGDKRNDKGCHVVVRLNQAEKTKFVLVLSKINESKLHSIFFTQMIPARENLLLTALDKSNDWELNMTWLSQSTQNTNHWD